MKTYNVCVYKLLVNSHVEKEPKWDLEDFYIKSPDGQIPIPFPFQQEE